MAAWNSNGLTVRTVTATTDSVLFTDDAIVYTAATNKTVSLPAGSNTNVQLGKVYRFVNAGAGTVTITPAAGLIDGAAAKVMATAPTAATPGCLTIVSDGTNWRSLSYTVGA
jgi:hypothetical protein